MLGLKLDTLKGVLHARYLANQASTVSVFTQRTWVTILPSSSTLVSNQSLPARPLLPIRFKAPALDSGSQSSANRGIRGSICKPPNRHRSTISFHFSWRHCDENHQGHTLAY